MPGKSPFKHLRFHLEIILCAVRRHLRFPLSHKDIVDPLEERAVTVDRPTFYRGRRKSDPN